MLTGAKKILAEVRDICEVVAEDQALLKMMKSMDLALVQQHHFVLYVSSNSHRGQVDPAYMCSVFFAYAMKIPLRVDISPVNFYGPYHQSPQSPP
jgi:hypothetical protein